MPPNLTMTMIATTKLGFSCLNSCFWCIRLSFKISFLLLNHFNIQLIIYIKVSKFFTTSHSEHSIHVHHSIEYLSHNNNYKATHSFFHLLPRLWNAIPIIDLHLSISTIKIKLKEYFYGIILYQTLIMRICVLFIYYIHVTISAIILLLQ